MTNHFELIDRIESLLGELRRELEARGEKNAHSPVTRKADQNFSGLTGSIFGLIKDGFFREPRTIADIQKKLRLEGIKKPTTSLMKPLLLLLKKKAIGRSQSADGKGPYKYHERGTK
jgi:hypothetical protein